MRCEFCVGELDFEVNRGHERPGKYVKPASEAGEEDQVVWLHRICGLQSGWERANRDEAARGDRT